MENLKKYSFNGFDDKLASSDILPLVSVITVNYNQSAATCEMLESLYACGYPNLEVIVVDNSSPSDTPKLIKEKFPQVTLIVSPNNIGFAGGNNLGIRQSSGRYLFLLNNDTIVPAGAVTRLIEELESRPKAGAVSPKIKFFDRQDTIQYAGYGKMSVIGVQCFAIGSGEKDSGQYDQAKITHYAHGAAMMLKREVIEKVGLMPEVYFLYYEELDWCEQIKKSGYNILYVPGAVILHKESLATGRNSPLKTYYLNRNRVVYVQRNMTGILFLINILYLLFIVYPKNMCVSLLKYDIQNAQSIYQAWYWNIKRLFDKNIHTNLKI